MEDSHKAINIILEDIDNYHIVDNIYSKCGKSMVFKFYFLNVVIILDIDDVNKDIEYLIKKYKMSIGRALVVSDRYVLEHYRKLKGKYPSI